MKSLFVSLTLVCILQIFAYAGTRSEQNPAGSYRFGLFTPLVYSWSDSLQVETHPLLFWVMPNARLRWQHRRVGGISWATEHGLVWPTPLLRLLSREGTGGLISPEFKIPHMVSLYNGIASDFDFNKSTRLNGYAGVSIALRQRKPASGSTIDLPWIYPRMQVFYSGYLFTFGAELDKRWTPHWSGRFKILALVSDHSAMEHLGMVCWTSAGGTEYRIGYWLSYARYPFGRQAHLIVPVFDIIWKFSK